MPSPHHDLSEQEIHNRIIANIVPEFDPRTFVATAAMMAHLDSDTRDALVDHYRKYVETVMDVALRLARLDHDYDLLRGGKFMASAQDLLCEITEERMDSHEKVESMMAAIRWWDGPAGEPGADLNCAILKRAQDLLELDDEGTPGYSHEWAKVVQAEIEGANA